MRLHRQQNKMKDKKLEEWDLKTIQKIKEQVKKGNNTLYTVLRSVSRSGMQRKIDVYMIVDNEPLYLTPLIAAVCGYSREKQGYALKVNGCGMDMGFHVVNSLSVSIGTELNHRWL